MPRLNLDIFGPGEGNKDGNVGRCDDEKPASRTGQSGTEPKNAVGSPAPPAAKKLGPRFIPVGFYPEDLRLLDDAVIALRRMGQWRASKSAIIRKLIEAHRDNLTDVYLGRR